MINNVISMTIWFKHIYSYFHLHSNIQIYILQYNHDGIQKLEELKRSPDLLNNVKIGQGQLRHII